MKLLLFTIVFFINFPVFSQRIAGSIIDADSKVPIEYVNIGILRKDRGIVSDRNGHFSLELHPQYDKDTLRISAIGYQSASFVVDDLKRVFQQSKSELIIELTKKIPILTQVVVTPKKLVKKVIGNKGSFKPITVNYESGGSKLHLEYISEYGYIPGAEVGTVIKIKKSPAYIQDVNFIINSNNYKDSIVFRINIYNIKNGVPGENILREPIVITTKVRRGILSVNLEQYNIYVEDDFFVALEWLREMGSEKSIGFGAGILNHNSFHRVVSLGDWEKVPLMVGLGFYATVLYIK
jgi:hypothetical protein